MFAIDHDQKYVFLPACMLSIFMRQDAHLGFHDVVDQISSDYQYHSANILKIYVSFKLAKKILHGIQLYTRQLLIQISFLVFLFFFLFSHCWFFSEKSVAK